MFRHEAPPACVHLGAGRAIADQVINIQHVCSLLLTRELKWFNDSQCVLIWVGRAGATTLWVAREHTLGRVSGFGWAGLSGFSLVFQYLFHPNSFNDPCPKKNSFNDPNSIENHYPVATNLIKKLHRT